MPTRSRTNRKDGPESGGGGIRTHEGLTPLPVFKTGSISRSDTPPGKEPLAGNDICAGRKMWTVRDGELSAALNTSISRHGGPNRDTDHTKKGGC